MLKVIDFEYEITEGLWAACVARGFVDSTGVRDFSFDSISLHNVGDNTKRFSVHLDDFYKLENIAKEKLGEI